MHLFEPHAPYGRSARSGRPVAASLRRRRSRRADAQVGRLLDALGADAPATLIVVAADHGEAFGEHGEISHSVFIYDTTLRVPLIVAGPGVPARTVDVSPSSLVDVAPTVAAARSASRRSTATAIDLRAGTSAGAELPARDLYAESFAPLLDFGWSPLRTLRRGGWKYIAAPRPELYDLRTIRARRANLVDASGRARAPS